MNETLELHSKMDLGMGHVVLQENSVTMDLGSHQGSIGRRSVFDSGFRKGSEVLFVLPEISIGIKKAILILFLGRFPPIKAEYSEGIALFFRVEHKREHAKTFWGRPLYTTTTLFKGIWKDPNLEEKGLVFSGLVTMDQEIIEIKKDLSFLGKILYKIRGWRH